MRTFERFLEDEGFQADACEATTHPDFYRLAKAMHQALEDIADQTEHPHAKCPSAYSKGNRARQAIGLASIKPKR